VTAQATIRGRRGVLAGQAAIHCAEDLGNAVTCDEIVAKLLHERVVERSLLRPRALEGRAQNKVGGGSLREVASPCGPSGNHAPGVEPDIPHTPCSLLELEETVAGGLKVGERCLGEEAALGESGAGSEEGGVVLCLKDRKELPIPREGGTGKS